MHLLTLNARLPDGGNCRSCEWGGLWPLPLMSKSWALWQCGPSYRSQLWEICAHCPRPATSAKDAECGCPGEETLSPHDICHAIPWSTQHLVNRRAERGETPTACTGQHKCTNQKHLLLVSVHLISLRYEINIKFLKYFGPNKQWFLPSWDLHYHVWAVMFCFKVVLQCIQTEHSVWENTLGECAINYYEMKLSSAGTNPPLLHMVANSRAHVPKAVCTQFAGAQVGKKGLVVQVSRIHALMAEWCFWSQGWDKEAGGHCRCTSPHCCKLFPLWLKWLPWDVKGWCLSHPFFVLLSFPFKRDRHWRLGHPKTTAYTGKIRNSLHVPKGRCRLRKDLRRPYVYTSGWSSAQRHTPVL